MLAVLQHPNLLLESFSAPSVVSQLHLLQLLLVEPLSLLHLGCLAPRFLNFAQHLGILCCKDLNTILEQARVLARRSLSRHQLPVDLLP